MEATIEIRYETLLDVVQQLPSGQLERLLADVHRFLESRRSSVDAPPVKYRTEVVQAARRLETGEGIEMNLEELQALIEA